MKYNSIIFQDQQSLINSYSDFLASCRLSDVDFSMSPSDVSASPFARCFWIFGLNSIKRLGKVELDNEKIASKIIEDLLTVRQKLNSEELMGSKPYKQLLAFSISAIHLISKNHLQKLEEFLIPFCELDVSEYLNKFGVCDGLAGSGNHAMFLCQFLIEAQQTFDVQTFDKQNCWVEYHLSSMNKFGLWGADDHLTYLQFQNGYHQYEIFDYLGIETGREACLANNLIGLSDQFGQFAPYPGGGGCFDYDAIFLIHVLKRFVDEKQVFNLFSITQQTILLSQNSDGGFAENDWVRPRNLKKFLPAFMSALRFYNQPPVFREKIKYLLTLQRPKHNHIYTHWSQEPRRWNESNLWDSWFRILTIARCWASIEPKTNNYWNWLKSPGIGYFNGK